MSSFISQAFGRGFGYEGASMMAPEMINSVIIRSFNESYKGNDGAGSSRTHVAKASQTGEKLGLATAQLCVRPAC